MKNVTMMLVALLFAGIANAEHAPTSSDDRNIGENSVHRAEHAIWDFMEAPMEAKATYYQFDCDRNAACMYRLPIQGGAEVIATTAADATGEVILWGTETPAKSVQFVNKAWKQCAVDAQAAGIPLVSGGCEVLVFTFDAVSQTIIVTGVIGQRVVTEMTYDTFHGIGEFLDMPGQFVQGDFKGVALSGVNGSKTLFCTIFKPVFITANKVLGAEDVDCTQPLSQNKVDRSWEDTIGDISKPKND